MTTESRWNVENRHILFHDVQEVLNRYARAVDRSDWEALIEVYHPDARDDHGQFKGSREGLVEYLTSSSESLTLLMHHLGNTILLEVDAERRLVVAETYCTGFMRYRPVGEAPKILTDALGGGSTSESVLVGMGNRYVDVLCENESGRLQILRRTVVTEWSQAFPAAQAIALTGRRTGLDAPKDFSYQSLDELLA